LAVVSFIGYTPPPRFDESAWEEARLEQSATEGGSYTTTETFTLDPVDDDPANPRVRDFTTTLGTDDLWYRIVWVDADANESAPTAPGQNDDGTVTGGVAAFVTADELGRILQVNATTNAAALNRVLAASAGCIVSETGRNDFSGWELDLVEAVSLAHSAEIWKQAQTPWGVALVGGIDAGPTMIARDTFARHAQALAPLKRSWGIA